MKKQLVMASLATLVSMVPMAANAEMDMKHSDGAAPAQELVPPHSVEMYLDGFHNYKTESHLPPAKQSQIRVSHYCHHVSPDLIQCLIYNGNGKDAKVIGIEYVIPEKVYATLPAKEKQYWHAHTGEVESGMLALPGMATQAEKDTLAFVKTTYGKTWHVWRPEDKLPLGEPALMWPVDPDKMNEATKQSLAQRKLNPAF